MLFQPHELESGSRQVVISSARPPAEMRIAEYKTTSPANRALASSPPTYPLCCPLSHSHCSRSLSLSLSPKDYPLGNS